GYLSISIMQDGHWEGLARATGRTEVLDDSRFDSPESREIHRNARIELTQEMVAGYQRDDLIATLEEYGVPCAPVLTRTEMCRHPQIAANGTLVEYDHPAAGRLRQARAPAQFSGTPADPITPAPALGEHTDTILNALSASDPTGPADD
ncbi:MAG TPA: CoA transferase, partial [Alphaproteobacteria bacterium]|nr:CoA transferase [Alphaproteobacteria bacterium]